MDAALKLLADASLAVSAAEDALEDRAYTTARDRLDAAGGVLGELRAAWPAMSGGERAVVGPAARTVRARLDAAGARVPRMRGVSEMAPAADPEEERGPD